LKPNLNEDVIFLKKELDNNDIFLTPVSIDIINDTLSNYKKQNNTNPKELPFKDQNSENQLKFNQKMLIFLSMKSNIKRQIYINTFNFLKKDFVKYLYSLNKHDNYIIPTNFKQSLQKTFGIQINDDFLLKLFNIASGDLKILFCYITYIYNMEYLIHNSNGFIPKNLH